VGSWKPVNKPGWMPKRDKLGRFAKAPTPPIAGAAGEFDELNLAAGLPLDTEWGWFPESDGVDGPWRPNSGAYNPGFVPK
jgi:hypothetical protein